jgi:hypothetical protein
MRELEDDVLQPLDEEGRRELHKLLRRLATHFDPDRFPAERT